MRESSGEKSEYLIFRFLLTAAHSQTGQGQQAQRGSGGFGDVGNGSVENASRTLIEAYSMLKAAYVNLM